MNKTSAIQEIQTYAKDRRVRLVLRRWISNPNQKGWKATYFKWDTTVSSFKRK
jgi:hypothetical protein